jgi:ubiquinone/menaquinone biosynthesis C-methylase UbiE
MDEQGIRKVVRENYGSIASNDQAIGSETGCGCGCGSEVANETETGSNLSKIIGYSDEDLENIPDEANLGLGCGNPVALAALKEGDTYLDLGSGAGIDCFFAAKRVGKTGKVIGVDMTPQMIDKARENLKKSEFDNVEFRLGEIEHLPVPDNTVDVITSNCVINLSPDKKAVFQEAYRVLKPGGRLMISDIVLEKSLPENMMRSIEMYVGCISGAMLKDEYLRLVKEAGFDKVEIVKENPIPEAWAEDPAIKSMVADAGIKPEEVPGIVRSIVSIGFTATKKDD